MRRRKLLQLSGACLAAGVAPHVRANESVEAYPSRPIKLIVPFSPGSLTDGTARLFAPRMAEALKGTIVVENIAGASGIIGSETAAKAAPDGYTLVMGGVTSHGTLVSLMKKLPYDVNRDFTPIGLAVAPPAFFVVHPSVPARNLKEFVEWSRTQPQGVSYGSSGVGSSGHLTAELLTMKTGAKLVQVPYKNVGQAITDLIAGHVKMMIYYAPLLPHVRKGDLRALAVLSDQRASFAPEVPTAREQGFENVTSSGWVGVLAPAGLSTPIRDKLYAALKLALDDPGLRKTLATQGQEAIPLPPAEFKAFMNSEITRWGEVVRVSGATME
ncbi:Bug family tripartite tricarboxylate transporter substrate binding protein [Hydrogenophaga sp. BPS33]|uniref:Bug family tripartite tricarboxylate transporter substrate binding protein n=1 Tax=Hydrogenophaga sp. BPS33 TaxID=2651974 RepID=UPI00131FF93D|nr:tripartite tricarboxylate transporter substrate binding protein [Hydrogenophaga sp. BPS33]QHE87034.1 tripartite tricarboxylate transporter substrate binding protein [Hydrogenophaga sp. BPS33]